MQLTRAMGALPRKGELSWTPDPSDKKTNDWLVILLIRVKVNVWFGILSLSLESPSKK